MPIPSALRSVLGDKRFWSAYFKNERYDQAAGLSGVAVELAPAAGYALVLKLADPVESLVLGFAYPGAATPVEIGSERVGLSCGNVLRWEELDRIARAVALLDPEFGHPGLGTLLLVPFAPIRPGDDVDQILPLLEAAFRSLDLFTEGEIDDQISRLDRRREAVAWRTRDPSGWVLDLAPKVLDGIDHEGYSTSVAGCERDADPGDFPHEAWDRMLAAAGRTIRDEVRPEWLLGEAAPLVRRAVASGDLASLPDLAQALEAAGCRHPTLLGACRNPAQAARACVALEILARQQPGALIRRQFGVSAREPSRYWRISIYVPIYREVYARDQRVGVRLREALRLALTTGDQVEVTHNILFPAYGARREVEGIEQYILLEATTWTDPKAKLAAVHALLAAAGPPPGTQVRFGDPITDQIERIPLATEPTG